MEANQVRQKFLEFFKSKDHEVVASAPMVIKNDPTLMFTNAGMNQFKDLFLGNSPIVHSRIADTQKCLRVSGKHNDLEEVGRDTYHHTMFEMLGNWSFGDYFKKEAIEWGWELLTDIYNIDKSRLYVTVFGGATDDGLPADEEAKSIWKKIVTEDKIIFGSKKDNFWEMGDTGPCGPCSEIHIDLRPESEIIQIPGKELVNKDHPQVIEIWNLVFIQYNRLSDGSLKELPARHVDTGMGFERLCRVIQGKSSNYDTDVFQPLILAIAKSSGINYGKDEKTDIAMRVIADHLRAIAFSTADGQLPSNTGAGYVIRRILRRAVRYGYSFLGFSEPFMCKIVPVLVKQLGNQFPELSSQEQLISKVIFEEETSFLRTLQTGLERIGKHIKATSNKVIAGEIVFELYDTYGFPPDLTSLIARENGFEIDQNGFQKALEEQKNRSRQAAKTETEDWVELCTAMHTEFLGYDTLEVEAKILKYRKIITKNKDLFQIVLDKTPFYAESGGAVSGDGLVVLCIQNIPVIDTKKENNLTIHISPSIPSDPKAQVIAKVDDKKRKLTERNHTATHLLHFALREVLGKHVEQKGSLVGPDRLRFDFSHFQKVTDEEIAQVEKMVNELIATNISICEHRELPIAEAEKLGAIALFGEKYGDSVRVVGFGKSIELCGGTHVSSTATIGRVIVVSEGAIAAGIRRIEAITSETAEQYLKEKLQTLDEILALTKNPKEPAKAIQELIDQNTLMRKQIEDMLREKAGFLCESLEMQVERRGDINLLTAKISGSAQLAKDIAYAMKGRVGDLFFLIGHEEEGKAGLALWISETLVKSKNWNASAMIRDLAKHIQGGGGGQPFFASAGGKNPAGIDAALEAGRKIVK